MTGIDDEKMSAKEREKRQQEDCEALNSGGIPKSAKHRIYRLKNAENQLFASTLSVNELLCASNGGVRPLSQVMGSAVMKLPQDRRELKQYVSQRQNKGLFLGGSSYFQQSGRAGSMPSLPTSYPHRNSQFSGGGSALGSSPGFSDDRFLYSYGQPVSGELQELTYCRLAARQLAVSRMTEEAQLLGASGVIGVKMKTEVRGWGGGRTLECTVMGTAVHVSDWKEKQPFTALLNAQDYWKLYQMGYEPMGIALGVCSYTDCTDHMALRRSYNQEVSSYTNCFYEAHAVAMDYLVGDVRRMRAKGAVGVEVEFELEDAESEVEISEGNEVEFVHLIAHIVITGTAVRRRQNAPAQPARPLAIYDLGKSSRKKRSDIDV